MRAASFAEAWRDAAYEKGETQSLYNEFFEVFDVRRRSVAHYYVAKLDNRSGFIDLFWPGVLIVEQKKVPRGEDEEGIRRRGSTRTIPRVLRLKDELGRRNRGIAAARITLGAVQYGGLSLPG